MALIPYIGFPGAAKTLFVTALVLLPVNLAFALVPPVYTPPTYKVGGAIGQGIAENLIRRGVAANDARLAATVEAIGTRSMAVVADTSGATWLTAAGRLTPWVTGAVVVYAGVNWWFDNQGKAYLAKPGTVSTGMVYSNGVQVGATVYYLSNQSDVLAGSIQEAFSYLTATARSQNSDASFGPANITQTGNGTWSVAYNYSIPSIHLNNMSYTATASAAAYNGKVVCNSGSVFISSKGVCSDAAMNAGPYAAAPIVGYSVETAYQNLPQPAKDAPMSPDLAAELANRHWQDAAKQPGYKGYPFPTDNPVTPGDSGRLRDNHPDAWPKNSDLPQPLPQPSTANPNPSPVVIPERYPPVPTVPNPTTVTTTGTTTNPDGTKSTTSTTTTIDWGQFNPPDLETPTIESILDPLFSMWPSWQKFSFPQHESSCPTPSYTFPSSVLGGYTITFTQLCTWTENVRPALQAGFALAWVLVIVFIVMGA